MATNMKIRKIKTNEVNEPAHTHKHTSTCIYIYMYINTHLINVLKILLMRFPSHVIWRLETPARIGEPLSS